MAAPAPRAARARTLPRASVRPGHARALPHRRPIAGGEADPPWKSAPQRPDRPDGPSLRRFGAASPGCPVEQHRTPHLVAFSAESWVSPIVSASELRPEPRHPVDEAAHAAARRDHGGGSAGQGEEPAPRPDPEPDGARGRGGPRSSSEGRLASMHLASALARTPAPGEDPPWAGRRRAIPRAAPRPRSPRGGGGEHLTTRPHDEAIAGLDRLEPPFLMHLAYYTVHTPLQAAPERRRAHGGGGQGREARDLRGDGRGPRRGVRLVGGGARGAGPGE